ncbi:hypothetical protein GGR98_002560 [Parageobacillus caldoxylosilyticus]|jgi:hypothetical protein|nr:hypothetical protein [Parageobacillus caldoxylosilyticus]
MREEVWGCWRFLDRSEAAKNMKSGINQSTEAVKQSVRA